DYPSIHEARRLAELVGANNLAAAFLLGRVDLMQSALTVALLGSPQRPLPAAELGSVVQRLAGLPAQTRERLYVNVYMRDVNEAEILRILEQNGGDSVSVFIASSSTVDDRGVREV